MSVPFSVSEESQRAIKRSRTISSAQQVPQEGSSKKIKPNIDKEVNRFQQIPEIPHFTLTLQQMNSDPIELFNELQQKYEKFGAVRLTVSQRWNCPFTFRYMDKGITTRVQCLQNLKQGKGFEQNIEAYTVQSFESQACNFESSYKFKTNPEGHTLLGRREQEYWTLVSNPEYSNKEVKVEYAADLPSTRYGSGFPLRPIPNWKDSDFVYEDNYFNLNNIKKCPTSVLRMAEERKEKVSGITQPWVYMGMQFSTFCWHVEDLWVNSLNYNHKGGIKTWYIVPGEYKQKFDNYVIQNYCKKSSKKNLLSRITFMVNPLQIIDAGIPVFKAYQHPRDYICTFFKAYHCGFSQSFNVGEAVNFLSPLSIPIMLEAEKYKQNSENQTPSVIPVEWIIHQNYAAIEKFKNQKYSKKIEDSFFEIIKKQEIALIEAKQNLTFYQIEVFPAKAKYDSLQCCVCKRYLFLHGFKFQKKGYCLKHIKETHLKDEISLAIRQPVEQRQYILSLFENLKVVESETQKRGRSKKCEKIDEKK